MDCDNLMFYTAMPCPEPIFSSTAVRYDTTF